MAKDSNFGKAMFEMFGVGKDESKPVQKETIKKKEKVEPEVVKKPLEFDDIEFKPDPVPVKHETAEAKPEVIIPEIKPSRPGKSVIAAGTFFEGTIKTEGDLDIAGDFKGNIISDGKVSILNRYEGNIQAGDLTIVSTEVIADIMVKGNVDIDVNSVLKGNVKAGNINCSGTIVGDLDIDDNLTLSEQAQINGNIRMSSLSVAKGAKVTGKIEMKA